MSATYHENLDLLILGDNGVGKSTLINCYLTRRFSSIPSGVLKSKIQLPGTEYGCKSVNVHLCDTRTYGKWNESLEKCIMESSAILIVGSWDNPQSINRIENHWLPSVSKLCASQSTPILILINKSDMLGGLDNVDFMNQEYRAQRCQQLQRHFMVKNVFQTSCIEIHSVVNAFDIAIQLIIYPVQRLVVPQHDYRYKSLQKLPSYPYFKAMSTVKRRKSSNLRYSRDSRHRGNYALNSDDFNDSNDFNDFNDSDPPQIITEQFLVALQRIFHLFDRDNDTLLTGLVLIFHSFSLCLSLCIFLFFRKI